MQYFVDRLYCPLQAGEREIRSLIAQRLGVSESGFRFQVLKRRFVLAHNKPAISYDFLVDTLEFVRNTNIKFFEGRPVYQLSKFNEKYSPVIVGAGFTGLFAAYLLARQGAKPIVLEQGEEISKRKNTCIYSELRAKILHESNYCNGEGGGFAMFGGYIEQISDATKNDYLLQIFHELGLSNFPEIEDFRFVSAEDVQRVCAKMKQAILSAGGQILFGMKAISVDRFLGWPKSVTYFGGGTRKTQKTGAMILASGAGERSLMTASDFRFLMKPAKPRLALFIECNGREFENAYYGRGRTGWYPPFFVKKKLLNNLRRDIELEFVYPNATLVNASTTSNSIDLAIVEYPWSGNGNAIACVSIALTKEEAERYSQEETLAFGGKFLSQAVKKEYPNATPAETLGDFLSKKDPILFGDVHSSYKGGVYLMNLHRLLPNDLDQAFVQGLYQAGREFPLLSRSGNVLIGFSTLGTAKILPEESIGSRGVYQAIPRNDDGRNLLKSAERALDAVEALLSGR